MTFREKLVALLMALEDEDYPEAMWIILEQIRWGEEPMLVVQGQPVHWRRVLMVVGAARAAKRAKR